MGDRRRRSGAISRVDRHARDDRLPLNRLAVRAETVARDVAAIAVGRDTEQGVRRKGVTEAAANCRTPG